MATHSSVLAWRIPGTGEPGGLPSMGSHRVWHDRSDLAAAANQYKGFPRGFLQCRTCRSLVFNPWVRKIPWRRAWQPTPVFLPGESQWKRSLEGYSPWGQKSQMWLKQLSTHPVCPRAYCASGKATSIKTNSLRSRRSRSTQGVCEPSLFFYLWSI